MQTGSRTTSGEVVLRPSGGVVLRIIRSLSIYLYSISGLKSCCKYTKLFDSGIKKLLSVVNILLNHWESEPIQTTHPNPSNPKNLKIHI